MSTSESNEELVAGLAAAVRRRRLALELSQEQLAQRAGLSRRMVAMLEGGDSNPSLGTVSRIADALRTSFAELVLDGQPPQRRSPVHVVPPGEGRVLWTGSSGSEARLLMSGLVDHRGRLASPPVELWQFTLAAGAHYSAEPDPAGMQEMLYTVSGTLTLDVEDRTIRLPEGASSRLDSDRPYHYRNEEDHRVVFTRVVLPPGPLA